MFSCHFLTLKRNESVEHFKGKLLLCQSFLLPTYGYDPDLTLIEEYPRRKKGRADIILHNIRHKRIDVWVEIQEGPLDERRWNMKIDTALKVGNKDMLYVVGLTPRAMYTRKSLKDVLTNRNIKFKIFSLNLSSWKISEIDI